MIRVALVVSLILLQALGAKEEAWEKLDAVPNRFEPVKDDFGFFWQLTGAGSFYTMGTNVFQSANELSVNGAKFEATAAYQLNETRFAFERESPGLKIRRDVWIDTKRSAVRHLEIITNRSADRELRLPIEVRSDFSQAWQDLYSNSGKLIDTRPGPRDAGMLLKFNSIDGRSDMLYLFGDSNGSVRPNVRAGNSNREIVFQYNLTIPAGATIAVLYWAEQRTVTNLATAPALFDPIYHRRGPLKSNLPREIAPDQVQNFALPSSPEPLAAAFDAEALVGLNRWLEELDAERGGEDLLWMSRENQLRGTVQPTQPLDFQSRFGAVQLEWSQIAGLRGGRGVNRYHEVFTRDGEVLIGTSTAIGARMGGADGWEMTLEPDSFDALFLKVSKDDGKLPSEVWGFAELKTGEVLAIQDGMESRVEFAIPWGRIQVPLRKVSQLRTMAWPSPRQQLELVDGSRLTGFVISELPLTIGTPRLGELQIDAGQLRAVWRAGTGGPSKPEMTPEFDQEWIAGVEAPTLWLEGRNRLPGNLSSQTLHVISEAAVTEVLANDIAWIRRTEEGILDQQPTFEIELQSGIPMAGRLRDTNILVEARGQQWEIPALHFLGFLTPNSSAQ
tara:strand:+ start:11492 stop:13339 length:1848 start_codon:yes stop_codon:yes gene_type:complete